MHFKKQPTVRCINPIAMRFYKKLVPDMTKTRNGLENGLVNGLSQTVWKASCITVKLFLVAYKS